MTTACANRRTGKTRKQDDEVDEDKCNFRGSVAFGVADGRVQRRWRGRAADPTGGTSAQLPRGDDALGAADGLARGASGHDSGSTAGLGDRGPTAGLTDGGSTAGPAAGDDAGSGGAAPPKTSGDDGTATGSAQAGVCITADPSTLPTCCEASKGRCAPKSAVDPALHDLLGICPGGGLCAPAKLFKVKGAFAAKACASIGGAKGVCLAACMPAVAPYASILPKDVCDTGEICTPCISPLDGKSTGACQTFACTAFSPSTGADAGATSVDATTTATDAGATSGGQTDASAPSKPAYSCTNPPTKAVVDVTIFPTCCKGARCVGKALVPATMVDDMNPCQGGKGVCVPEPFVATAGVFTPKKCAWPDGIEGRCLSSCLPLVADQLDKLPVAGCGGNDRCVPCCDPITGKTTGACDLGCDTGPAAACSKPAWTTCCKGAGHCVPKTMVPQSKHGNLTSKGCSTKQQLCVPDSMQDDNFKPKSCTGKLLFKYPYTGVCLPKCLKIPLDILIWSGSCDKTDDCVPCADPTTGKPTGAPGCPPVSGAGK